MKFKNTILKQSALLLLIIFAVSSSLLLFKKRYVRDFSEINRNEISLYEIRYQKLKKMIPERGNVGYVSDKRINDFFIVDQHIRKVYDYDSLKHIDDIGESDIEAMREYVISQYALSPIVLRPTMDYEIVIGNFSNSDINYKRFLDDSLVLVEDFNNGVMLFKDSTR